MQNLKAVSTCHMWKYFNLTKVYYSLHSCNNVALSDFFLFSSPHPPRKKKGEGYIFAAIFYIVKIWNSPNVLRLAWHCDVTIKSTYHGVIFNCDVTRFQSCAITWTKSSVPYTACVFISPIYLKNYLFLLTHFLKQHICFFQICQPFKNSVAF